MSSAKNSGFLEYSLCACGLSRFSWVWPFSTLWTVVHQAPTIPPWDAPGTNTGMCCHFLLQGIFPIQGSNPCLLHLLHCRRILRQVMNLMNLYVLTGGPRLIYAKYHCSGYRKKFRDGCMTQIVQWVLSGLFSPTDIRKVWQVSLAERRPMPGNKSHPCYPMGAGCLRRTPTDGKADVRCGQKKAEFDPIPWSSLKPTLASYPSYTSQGPVCLKVVQVRCFHLNRSFTYIIPLALLLFLFYR